MANIIIYPATSRIAFTSTNSIVQDIIQTAAGAIVVSGSTGTASFDNGAATFSSSVTATSLIKSDGTSSQYLMADGSTSTLTNPVTGTGTTNYLPKFTGASTIGNSAITDDGTTVTLISRALSGTTASFSGSGSTTTLSLQASNGVGTLRWLNGAGTSIWTTYSPSGTGLVFRDVVYGVDVLTLNQNSTSVSLSVPLSGTSATFSGKVGVGGASATYSLTAYNSANGTTAAFGGTVYGLRIDNGGTFSSGRTTIFGVDNSFYGSYQPLSLNASILYFGIAGSDKMTLDASGNLGLGVTPSDWFVVFKALQIGNYGAAISGQTNDEALVLWNNAYPNASNVDTYTANKAANKFQMAAGAYKWFSAPAGTGAITFTQAMTLFANGGLGLNTTTPTTSTGYTTFSTNGSTGGQIEFQTSGVGKAYIYSNSTDLRFYTNGGAFRFENTTGLEVGYSSAIGLYKLDVNGTGRFTGDLTALSITTSAYSYLYGLRISGNDTGNTIYQATGALGISTGSSAITFAPSLTTALTLASTGAATFSSSVTMDYNFNGSSWFTAKNTNAGSGAAAGLLMTNNDGDLAAISLLSSTNSPANALFIRTLSTNSLVLGTNNGTNLTIASTGAATFSSSVTATQFKTPGFVEPTSVKGLFNNTNYSGPGWNNASLVTGNGATGVMMGGDAGLYAYGWIQGVQTDTGGVKGLYLNPLGGTVTVGGAATFSSTIKQSSAATTTGATAEFYNVSMVGYGMYIQAGTTTNYSLLVTNYLGATAFQVLGNGAATFSSSVSIGGADQGYQLDVKRTSTGDATFDTVANFYKASTHNTGLLLRLKNTIVDLAANNITGGGGPSAGMSFSVSSGGTISTALTLASTGAATFSSSVSCGDIFSTGQIQNNSLSGSGVRNVNATAAGELTVSTSDSSLKKNVENATYGLDVVMALRPVTYNWIPENKLGTQKELGFIAQEVQELIPEVIGTNYDGKLSLDYAKIVAVLTKAIQEQQVQIKELKSKINK